MYTSDPIFWGVKGDREKEASFRFRSRFEPLTAHVVLSVKICQILHLYLVLTIDYFCVACARRRNLGGSRIEQSATNL